MAVSKQVSVILRPAGLNADRRARRQGQLLGGYGTVGGVRKYGACFVARRHSSCFSAVFSLQAGWRCIRHWEPIPQPRPKRVRCCSATKAAPFAMGPAEPAPRKRLRWLISARTRYGPRPRSGSRSRMAGRRCRRLGIPSQTRRLHSSWPIYAPGTGRFLHRSKARRLRARRRVRRRNDGPEPGYPGTHH